MHDSRVSTALFLMETDPALSLGVIAERVGLSVSRLQHLFASEVGTSFSEYRHAIRLKRAKDILDHMDSRPLKQVCAEVGIESLPTFIRYFREHFGVTPAKYRKGRTVL